MLTSTGTRAGRARPRGIIYQSNTIGEYPRPRSSGASHRRSSRRLLRRGECGVESSGAPDPGNTPAWRHSAPPHAAETARRAPERCAAAALKRRQELGRDGPPPGERASWKKLLDPEERV